MKLLIKNGTVIDPTGGIHGKADIVVSDGVIADVLLEDAEDEAAEGGSDSGTSECGDMSSDFSSENISSGVYDRIIDATGLYVMPGFVDLHVHFREPGFTHKETVKTGSMAAAHGGYTSVFCMPNTKPVIDSAKNYKMLSDIIERDACVHVYPVGAVTKGQAGCELAEIEKMATLGMKAISEDGKSVMDSGLYRKAMKLAESLDLTVMAHCEDINLVEGGVMNSGKRAGELGLSGISNAVEDIIAARDVLLAKETGVRLHLCHCSTADSVEILRFAKEDGLSVTGEVCPHHFTMCDEDIPCDDANYKMNPPLRSKADLEAIREGIKNGYLNVISTDHAPHSAEEKAASMSKAPFGIVGLETAFALAYTELVCGGLIDLDTLVRYMSSNPAKVAGIQGGSLAVGKPADITVVDLASEYEIDKNEFVSMGKNTPFDGRKVKGKVMYTVVSGKMVYQA